MGINQEDLVAFQAWLLENAKQPCTGCGGSAWKADEHALTVPYTSNMPYGVGPEFAPLRCGFCGLTRLHDVRAYVKDGQ
jgi:hypothetical protein